MISSQLCAFHLSIYRRLTISYNSYTDNVKKLNYAISTKRPWSLTQPNDRNMWWAQKSWNKLPWKIILLIARLKRSGYQSENLIWLSIRGWFNGEPGGLSAHELPPICRIPVPIRTVFHMATLSWPHQMLIGCTGNPEWSWNFCDFWNSFFIIF